MMSLLRAVLSMCLILGCGREDKPSPASKRIAPDPANAPNLVIRADSAHIYRYFPEGSRKAATATRMDDIPMGSRDMVLVIPEKAPPAGLAYVADLREPGSDGTFSYRVVPMGELDRALDQSRGQGPSTSLTATAGKGNAAQSRTPAESSSPASIIMFSASWCGVCTKARRWFRNKGIQYTERDIETDDGAQDELAKLADKAGVPRSQLTGVPVIWVNGKLFSGFDPRAIETAM